MSFLCSMRIWTQNPRGKPYPKPLSQTQLCAHRRVHTSWPHPDHCCRFSADLPSTCHMLLMMWKLPLWRIMIEKDTDCLLPHPRCSLSLKIEPWRQTLITTPKAGSPVLPFQWGQQPLPRPVVAPSCKIDCSYSAAKYMTSQILSLFLNPKPVNSRKKSVSSQCFTVTCYNTENISKRDRTRRLERIYLCGRPAGV